MPKKNEFELIKSLFAPLAENMAGAFGLRDDAAQLTPPRPPPPPRKGYNFVISVDCFISGVHFRRTDPADCVGEKILRASLSDLAAMGAQPRFWLLSAAFAKKTDFAVMKKFAKGCARAQKKYGVALIGGDTVATLGASVFSVTVIGEAKKPVRRNGAKAGDQLYITGTLADSALGLKFPRHKILARRYLYPEPRLDLGRLLPGCASAAIDLSDGLMADCAHLCRESQAGAVIWAHCLPLSSSARAVQPDEFKLRRLALNAGDDYELLIAAAPRHEKKLFAAARAARTKITHIGEVSASRRIIALDEKNRPVKPLHDGFRHFG